MSHLLSGPGDRYRVEVDALAGRRDEPFTHHRVNTGFAEEGGAVRVVAGDALSLTMHLGDNGITVRSIRLMRADRAVVTARVTAGAGAPAWLPTESTYLLFQGDRNEAEGRFIPFEGMAAERSWPAAATPLDRLAVAIGRSVARANAALARTQAEAGVAMVSSVTVRVAVEQTDVGQGRVMVTLARPDRERGSGQFVELTMTTVPGAEPEGAEEERTAAPSPSSGPGASPAGEGARR
ncbi:MAG TPA: hypothetical protein VD902_02970 [Symbiobacteriaceae bacterium]|nr:hypothetical protein [Symbiobacteriaceae bacterium]